MTLFSNNELTELIRLPNISTCKRMLESFGIHEEHDLYSLSIGERRELEDRRNGESGTVNHIHYVLRSWKKNAKYLLGLFPEMDDFVKYTSAYYDDKSMRNVLTHAYLEDIHILQDSLHLNKEEERSLIESLSHKSGEYLHEILGVQLLFQHKTFLKSVITNKDYFDINLSSLNLLLQEGILGNSGAISKLEQLYSGNGGFITPELSRKYLSAKSEEEQENILEEFGEAQTAVLSSKALNTGEYDITLLSEIIFLAYRPTGYTIERITDMIGNGSIQDLSFQLERISFQEEGYTISLKELVSGEYREGSLKDQKKVEEKMEAVCSIVERGGFQKETFSHHKNALKFFRVEGDFVSNYQYLKSIYSMNYDDRLQEYRHQVRGGDFDELERLEEVFGVITEDSFKDILESISEKYLSEGIFEKVSKYILTTENKKLLDMQSILQSDLSDKEKCIKLLEWRLSKYARQVRLFLSMEKGKYGVEEGEALYGKCLLSKNIGSFYAKAGAELCTKGDITLWKEARHIHLNMVFGNQIVGNVMLYFEEDRDYFVVRGFNPRVDFLSKVDSDTLIEELIRIIKLIAKENNYSKVYIPEQDSWHALSNRPGMASRIINISRRNKKKDDYKITDNPFIVSSCLEGKEKKLYLLCDVVE